MPILDPIDKNRLLAVEGFRKFVENKEKKYVTKIKAWKKQFNDPELNHPNMLAATLTSYLMIYDEDLFPLICEICKDDATRIKEFYEIIGKYFVDSEEQITNDD